MNGNGEDIEVEEIVVNGESVLENMENDDGAFDPSMLCSVEITAVNRKGYYSSECGGWKNILAFVAKYGK